MRGPIFAFGFGCVIVYQFFLKNGAFFKKKEPEHDDSGLGELTSKLKTAMQKKGKKITPKMEKDLFEIDSMLNSVGNMGNNLDKMDRGFKGMK